MNQLIRRLQMYFTIDWPHNHIFGAEHLKLAFESAAEADAWHRELERAIGEGLHTRLSLVPGVQCICNLVDSLDTR